MYAEHYDLIKHIKFGHKVGNIEKAPDYATAGRWTVKYTDKYEGASPTKSDKKISVMARRSTIPSTGFCYVLGIISSRTYPISRVKRSSPAKSSTLIVTKIIEVFWEMRSF